MTRDRITGGFTGEHEQGEPGTAWWGQFISDNGGDQDRPNYLYSLFGVLGKTRATQNQLPGRFLHEDVCICCLGDMIGCGAFRGSLHTCNKFQREIVDSVILEMTYYPFRLGAAGPWLGSSSDSQLAMSTRQIFFLIG